MKEFRDFIFFSIIVLAPTALLCVFAQYDKEISAFIKEHLNEKR